ncbi:MAG: hypothetical protein Kow00127_09710 [Bacteroidales bacterium]
MKLYGIFREHTTRRKFPDGFRNFSGIMADQEPLVYHTENHRYILCGHIYSVPGYGEEYPDDLKALQDVSALYESSGESSLVTVDGDFTLFIFNGVDIKIFRDFKGTGPQIFYSGDYFSNDLILLTRLHEHLPEPDFETLTFFLMFGYIPADSTGLTDIRRLPGGYILKYGQGAPQVYPADKTGLTSYHKNGKSHENEFIEAYTELHKKAIKNRISGKEKISLLLSGGYDSGANLAALREFYDGPLTSYTVSFRNHPFSELKYTRILADKFGSDLVNYEITGEEIAELPGIVKQTGIPFQESGLLINYLVTKTVAKDQPDVVLGGDGNDQLFGTANRELAMKFLTQLTGINALQKLFAVSMGANESGSLFQKLNLFNDKIDNIILPDHWGFRSGQLLYDPKVEKHIHRDKVFTTHFEQLYENRRKNIDINQTAFQVILFKASQMAQLHGVHLTFPYLARELHDFVNVLPLELKIHGSVLEMMRAKGVSKYLHKKAYRDKLPPEVNNRPKQGGFVPLALFFKDEGRNEEFFRMIENSRLLCELLSNKGHEIKKLRTALKDKNPWFWFQQVHLSRMLNMLVLAIWEKLILEQQDVDTI